MRIPLFAFVFSCILAGNVTFASVTNALLHSIKLSNSDSLGESMGGGINFIDGSSSTELEIEHNEVAETPESSSVPKYNSDLIPTDLEDKIAEIVKLGWTAEAAKLALMDSEYDVMAAAELLEVQQEEEEARVNGVKELIQQGWNDLAAESAVNSTRGNSTAAAMMLEKELVS